MTEVQSGAGPAPVALLLDEAEARRFEAERPEVRAILVLTPAAWGALEADSRKLVAPDPIDDRAHARMTARSRRAARRFEAALDREGGLRRGTWYLLTFTIQVHAFITARVWELLRGAGPWLIPTGAGWARHETREEAHAAYMERLRDYYPYVENAPPANPLFRFLCRLVLYLVRGRGRWVLTTRSGIIFGLEKTLHQTGAGLRVFTFEVRGAGVVDYLNLWRALRDGLRGQGAVKLPVPVRPKPQAGAEVQRALEAIDDPVIQRGLRQRERAYLQEETAYSEGLYDEALHAIEILKPICYINRQDSGRPGMVADAAGGAGVPRYVINYNSFPPSESAVAQHLLRFFFHARMPEGLSDHFLMWSPHLEKLSRGVYSPRGVAATRAIRLVPPALEEMTRTPGPHRVLHASNFTEWGYFFPTIMETSLEFARDILALERALDPIDGLELTVRTKPKGECNPETLRRLLPADTKAKVTGVEVPFPKALAEADLLVGYMSTTIEEAVLARTPVLLWGPTDRYRQLPARVTPPTPEDRAAVYAVRSADELGPMVSAILAAHSGRPLTDAEIADHVWPEGTPTLTDFADSIAAGRSPAVCGPAAQALADEPLG